MKQKQLVHGSDFDDYPIPASEPVDLKLRQNMKLDTIGFRLVSAGENQAKRGGTWYGLDGGAGLEDLLHGPPQARFSFLGFRLAFDNTKETT